MSMIGNAPYSGLISGANIVDESIGASALKDGLLSNFKNKVANGSMDIAQRGTSFSAVATDTYIVDMYKYQKISSGVLTITQDSDVPSGTGFTKSLKHLVTTADSSIAAGDYHITNTYIEGYNIRDLIDTTFTVSFWVKSSKTGIHCFRLMTGSSNDRYVKEYVIDTANTWEKKVMTFVDGLPSNLTLYLDNGLGLRLSWILMTGSTWNMPSDTWSTVAGMSTANQVNCLDTVGNIFAITGVQLEKGSSATDFEFRPVDVELRMCQRYYEIGIARSSQYTTAGGNHFSTVFFKVSKRVVPTLTNTFSGSNSNVYYQQQPNIYGFEYGAQAISAGSANCSGGWTAAAEF